MLIRGFFGFRRGLGHRHFRDFTILGVFSDFTVKSPLVLILNTITALFFSLYLLLRMTV